MSDPYGSGIGGSTTNMPSTEFFSGSSTTQCKRMCDSSPRPARCRRRCLAGMPDDSGSTSTTTPGTSGTTSLGGVSNQYDPTAQQPLDPSVFSGSVAGKQIQAPAGSYAADLGQGGLDLASNNPAAFYENFLSKQYGIGPGTGTEQFLMENFSPQDKVFGILSKYPDSNIDMVNFGASMADAANAVGSQLSPHAMITNLVNQSLDVAGGIDQGDQVSTNPLASAINAEDPIAGIRNFMSIMRGMLTGTMPDAALDGYLFNLQMYAQSLITGAGGYMNQGVLDYAKGGSWFERLVGALGPQLGL